MILPPRYTYGYCQGHGHGKSVTAMAAYDGQSGSKDRGDPQVSDFTTVDSAEHSSFQTTNLFVANIPTQTTEPNLGKFFARAGPVGSVSCSA